VSWCWLALLPEAGPTGGAGPVEVLARADASDLDTGAPAGTLVAWSAGPRPHPAALRSDAAAVDPAGAACRVSLLLLGQDEAPLFDDPAVSGAIRRVLAGPAPSAVTTLTRDPVHLAGAVWVTRGSRPRPDDDPFARLGPVRRLAVGPGLFAATPPVAGPVGQRYAGQPWPATGFGGAGGFGPATGSGPAGGSGG